MYVADSVTALRGRQMAALDRGDYEFDNGHPSVFESVLPDHDELVNAQVWDHDDHGGLLHGMPAHVLRLLARKAGG